VGVTRDGDAEVPDKEQSVGKTIAAESVKDVLAMFPDEGRKFSLQGENDVTVMKEFADKKEAGVGKVSAGIGWCCKKGLKPEAPNQDDFVMLQCGSEFGLYGVFDGHGPAGHDVSNYINRVLPGFLVRDGKFKKNPEEAIKAAFIQTQRAIQKQFNQKVFDASMSGATCTVVVLRSAEDGSGPVAHFGHCGDSRAIMGVGKDWSKMRAVEMTPDHKAQLPEERKRIEASGGVVRKRQGDVPWRVFMKGSQLPGLAMSRSLGDLIAQKCGVSHIPDIKTVPLTAEHQVLIVASDGVWEFLSNEKVLEEVKRFSADQIQEACEHLAALSWQCWIANEFDVVDDITVIGIVLDKVMSITATGAATVGNNNA